MIKTPCEIIVWELLPTIRATITEEMSKNKMTQKEISKILGITQAAVSQYVSKKRGDNDEIKAIIRDIVVKNLDNIIHGDVNNLHARICKICMTFRAKNTSFILKEKIQ